LQKLIDKNKYIIYNNLAFKIKYLRTFSSTG